MAIVRLVTVLLITGLVVSGALVAFGTQAQPIMDHPSDPPITFNIYHYPSPIRKSLQPSNLLLIQSAFSVCTTLAANPIS